ncbi:MAG: hypothetical protein CMJ78_25110 [Planctomycetaceae bacterium]|nr:hypothetical protein [Planctomycetaceae bacterium]
MKWVPTGKTEPPKSRGGTATTIVFQNKSEQSVKLYWISYQGERRFYSELKSGKNHRQNTYSNAVWLVTDKDDKPLGHFITGGEEANAIIK